MCYYSIADLPPAIRPKTLARFWTKVKKSLPDQCWIWVGQRNAFGYGKFGVGTVRTNWAKLYAHRVAWELATNTPPGRDKCVLHHCDNPSCVNPAHLFIGTHADNVADKIKKGRGNTGDRNGSRTKPEAFPRGEACYGSKLSENDVRDIFALRDEGLSPPQIARSKCVTPGAIHAVLKRRTWKHVSVHPTVGSS